MTLKDLIKGFVWEEIATLMAELYPKQKKNISGYEKVFNILKKKKPVKTNCRIIIEWIPPDEKEKEKGYFSVIGADEQKYPKDTLALELTPWNEWLGMHIDVRTMKKFYNKTPDIVCHCLWEMTFLGVDEKRIKFYAKGIMK